MQKHWQKMATVTKFIIGIKNNKSFPQEIILGIDNAEIATIKAHTHTPTKKKCKNVFPGREICCSKEHGNSAYFVFLFRAVNEQWAAFCKNGVLGSILPKQTGDLICKAGVNFCKCNSSSRPCRRNWSLVTWTTEIWTDWRMHWLESLRFWKCLSSALWDEKYLWQHLLFLNVWRKWGFVKQALGDFKCFFKKES